MIFLLNKSERSVETLTSPGVRVWIDAVLRAGYRNGIVLENSTVLADPIFPGADL